MGSWRGEARGDILRSREQSGGRRASGSQVRCLAPNGSDSVQALAFGLPGSRRSALTCGGGGTLYLSADFYQLRGGRACACVCLSVCVSVPDLGTSRPGFSATLTGRSPWLSVSRSGPDSRGGEPGGWHTGPGTRRRPGRGHLKRPPARAQTMTRPGAGSWGLCVGSPRRIAVPPSSLAGSAARMLLRCAAPLIAQLGTRVGPAFVYRPRHWARAARCAPPAAAASPPPSWEKLVHAVR